MRSLIKKFSYTALLALLFVSGSNYIKAQDIDFDIKVTDASATNNFEGSILIEVDGIGSDYTFMLFDKDPLKGGKKIAEHKSGNEYVFNNLKPGNYSVCVQNRDKATRCKNISIEQK